MAELSLERDVAPGIHRIEDAHTNWYLVEGDAGLTVVDAGVRASWRSLRAALPTLGKSGSDLRAVVLTHAHFDHLGFAERARQEFGVPVWVHEDDVPLTRHPMRYGHERSRLPYLLHPGGVPLLSAMAARGAFFPDRVKEVQRFDDDAGELPVPGSPRVVPTPGHTLGHCALHFADRDAVLVGDAIVTLDPYTGRRGPRLVARAATADSERAFAALDPIAATGAKTVLTGHGPVWRTGASAAAERAREAGIA